jgi:hypothetical protein
MKKLITLITVLSLVSVLHAQKYQTTLKYINNRLEIYIMPEATLTNAGFSSIEFFVRFPATLPLMFSDFQPETSNFPLITFGGNELTPIVRGTDATNKSIKISYLAGATETTLRTYTGGVEYKVCSMAVTGSPTATFQIVHNDVTFDPYFVTLTDNNSEDAAPASPNNYFYPATISNVSDPTLFYYEISNVALPVTLLDFTAKVENKGVLLAWKTESEVNLSHFDVEKSLDGKAFIKIGETKANNLPSDYSTFDENFNESSYYRLITNDLDGKKHQSKIIYLVKKSDKYLEIVRDTEGSFAIETADKIEIVTVTNSIGQILKTTKDKRFSIAELNAGIYIVSVKTDRGFASQKFFKD